MFRASWASMVFLAMGIAGVAPAATYTVNPTLPNVAPNYHTVTAAFTAAKAAVGDPNPIIEIQENNGGLGYSSATRMDLDVVKNITITATVAARIICTGNQEVFRNSSTDLVEKKLSVIGASPAAPITLANTNVSNTIELISCNNATVVSPMRNGLLHIENVVLEKPATGTGPFMRADSYAVGQHVLKNVTLTGGSSSNATALMFVGPFNTLLTADVSMEAVSFSQAAGATAMLSVRNRINLEAKNCVFRVPTGSNQNCVRGTSTATPSASTGGSQVIFRDCSFQSGNVDAFVTLGETGHTTRNVYKLYRPTIYAAGPFCFNMDNRPVEVSVLGLDDSDLPTVPKVSLDTMTFVTSRIARLNGNSKFSMAYCTGSDAPGAKTVGHGTATFIGNPEINITNCEFVGTGQVLFNGMAGAFGPVINVTNTVYRKGSGVSGPFIDNTTGNLSALPAQITLTHCTFVGNSGVNPPNAYVTTNAADLVYAPGTIFSGPSLTTNFAGTVQPSTVPTLAWNSAGLSGIGNAPPGTIVANPNLTSTGRLQATSPGAAFNAATTLLVTNDIDGQSRPLPAASLANDIGADEALFPVTDLALSNLTVSDEAGDGDFIANITITDPDNDSTLSLSGDAGGRFAVSGNTLVVGDSSLLDGVAVPTWNIEVLAIDLGGAIYAGAFQIEVTHTAPTVVSAEVLDGSTVQVTFSRAMGALALDPAQYAVSGTGQGTLSVNPASVNAQSATVYDLVWNAPDEMRIGGDITITAAGTLLDLEGAAMGTPDSATDAAAGIGVAPTLDSVTSVTPSPTNADDVAFSYTFSEPMGAVPSVDIVASGVASSGATVTDGPTTFTATVNGVAGDGTLVAGLSATPTATDLAGNVVDASALTASVVIDNTAPFVQTITAPDTSPTNAPSVLFAVTLSEPVSGFDTADCAVNATGGINGASVTSSNAVSASLYEVDVQRGSGDGLLRLNILANGTVLDVAGNALVLPFTTGAAYTISELRFTQDLPAVVNTTIGDPASLPVAVTGGIPPRQFTWYYAEELAGPFSPLPDLTTNSGEIASAVEADSGYYYVEVSDTFETIASTIAHLVVDDGVPLLGLVGGAALLAGLGFGARRALRKK